MCIKNEWILVTVLIKFATQQTGSAEIQMSLKCHVQCTCTTSSQSKNLKVKSVVHQFLLGNEPDQSISSCPTPHPPSCATSCPALRDANIQTCREVECKQEKKMQAEGLTRPPIIEALI